MTLQLTGVNGLFQRLGTIGQVLKDTNAFQGTTLVNDSNAIYAQFLGNVSQEQMIDGIAPALLAGQQSAGSYIEGFLATTAQNIVTTMVYQATGLLNTQSDIGTALENVILQMQEQSATVALLSVACTAAAGGSNVGNGVMVVTVYRFDGLTQQNQLPETISCTISQDSTSGAQAGNEVWTVNGATDSTNGDALSWLFPSGDGNTVSVTSVNASNNNDGVTLLNNGDFESWTTNTPNNWTINVGTAGSQVFQASEPYTGTYSCEFLGDGTTLTSIEQQFNNSSGTTSNLNNLTLYSVNGWIKTSSTPAAGVLEFSLTNGSTVINDNEGNPNAITQSLTSIGTSWTPFNGTFRTPYLLPTDAYLRISLSTALSSSRSVFIDRVGFAQATQIYPGGPSVTFFSGSSNWLGGTNNGIYSGDTFTASATNGYGSGGVNTWQVLMDRLFDMKSQGYLLPYSNSPTIGDNLI